MMLPSLKGRKRPGDAQPEAGDTAATARLLPANPFASPAASADAGTPSDAHRQRPAMAVRAASVGTALLRGDPAAHRPRAWLQLHGSGDADADAGGDARRINFSFDAPPAELRLVSLLAGRAAELAEWLGPAGAAAEAAAREWFAASVQSAREAWRDAAATVDVPPPPGHADDAAVAPDDDGSCGSEPRAATAAADDDGAAVEAQHKDLEDDASTAVAGTAEPRWMRLAREAAKEPRAATTGGKKGKVTKAAAAAALAASLASRVDKCRVAIAEAADAAATGDDQQRAALADAHATLGRLLLRTAAATPGTKPRGRTTTAAAAPGKAGGAGERAMARALEAAQAGLGVVPGHAGCEAAAAAARAALEGDGAGRARGEAPRSLNTDADASKLEDTTSPTAAGIQATATPAASPEKRSGDAVADAATSAPNKEAADAATPPTLLAALVVQRCVDLLAADESAATVKVTELHDAFTNDESGPAVVLRPCEGPAALDEALAEAEAGGWLVLVSTKRGDRAYRVPARSKAATRRMSERLAALHAFVAREPRTPYSREGLAVRLQSRRVFGSRAAVLEAVTAASGARGFLAVRAEGEACGERVVVRVAAGGCTAEDAEEVRAIACSSGDVPLSPRLHSVIMQMLDDTSAVDVRDALEAVCKGCKCAMYSRIEATGNVHHAVTFGFEICDKGLLTRILALADTRPEKRIVDSDALHAAAMRTAADIFKLFERSCKRDVTKTAGPIDPWMVTAALDHSNSTLRKRAINMLGSLITPAFGSMHQQLLTPGIVEKVVRAAEGAGTRNVCWDTAYLVPILCSLCPWAHKRAVPLSDLLPAFALLSRMTLESGVAALHFASHLAMLAEREEFNTDVVAGCIEDNVCKLVQKLAFDEEQCVRSTSPHLPSAFRLSCIVANLGLPQQRKLLDAGVLELLQRFLRSSEFSPSFESKEKISAFRLLRPLLAHAEMFDAVAEAGVLSLVFHALRDPRRLVYKEALGALHHVERGKWYRFKLVLETDFLDHFVPAMEAMEDSGVWGAAIALVQGLIEVCRDASFPTEKRIALFDMLERSRIMDTASALCSEESDERNVLAAPIMRAASGEWADAATKIQLARNRIAASATSEVVDS